MKKESFNKLMNMSGKEIQKRRKEMRESKIGLQNFVAGLTLGMVLTFISGAVVFLSEGIINSKQALLIIILSGLAGFLYAAYFYPGEDD